MKLSPKLSAMLASYGRSFAAAALAVWSTGNHDIKGVVAAGLAAVLPVAMRALNPKDPAFGLVANLVAPEIEKKLKEITEASTKTAKKAATKKKAN